MKNNKIKFNLPKSTFCGIKISRLDNKNKQQGFSLIELMVSITVLSILLALATPNQAAWIASSRIRTAGDSIFSGMQATRSMAINRNSAVYFVIAPTTTGWQVIDNNGSTVLNQKSQNENNTSYNTTVTPLGATTITFDGRGRTMNNVDGSPTITKLTFTNNTGQAAAKTLNITIGIGGVVRLCDPSISDPTDTRAC